MSVLDGPIWPEEPAQRITARTGIGTACSLEIWHGGSMVEFGMSINRSIAVDFSDHHMYFGFQPKLAAV
jgi:hypothetical protein